MGNDDQPQITIDWPATPPVEPANVFRVSRIQDEVQVLVGYVNVTDMIDRAKERKTFAIGTVSARGFSLSARAFRELHARVNEIYEAMQRGGVYDED